MQNAYLLSNTETRQAVLIDPGEDAPVLLEALRKDALSLQAIWLTHAHFDHIGAVEAIKAVHDVPVLLHPADKALYDNAYKAAQAWGIPFTQPTVATTDISEGQTLMLATSLVQCLFTPGHAPGHISFYLPEQGIVIAGDALFQGSIGRTDLPLGNHEELIHSIRTELLTLPDATVVYPGHGPETTIGVEKISNPFLL